MNNFIKIDYVIIKELIYNKIMPISKERLAELIAYANIPSVRKEAELQEKYNRAIEKSYKENEKNGTLTKPTKVVKKSTTKLPTEKRYKDDYKIVKGNIQKSRSDLRVNPNTYKREITTNMTINKGLTNKDKTSLKNFIINSINTNSKNDIIKDNCIFEIELDYDELNNIIIKDVYIRDGMSKRVYDGIKESISLLLDE
jgi:hypothetical protein